MVGVGGVAARADGAERTILLVSKRTEEVLDLRNVTNVNVVCTRGVDWYLLQRSGGGSRIRRGGGCWGRHKQKKSSERVINNGNA